MNKAVIKVVGTHALIVGSMAAAATVVIDVIKLSKPAAEVAVETVSEAVS